MRASRWAGVSMMTGVAETTGSRFAAGAAAGRVVAIRAVVGAGFRAVCLSCEHPTVASITEKPTAARIIRDFMSADYPRALRGGNPGPEIAQTFIAHGATADAINRTNMSLSLIGDERELCSASRVIIRVD